jgi:uncharacterized protein (UPF0332 family)
MSPRDFLDLADELCSATREAGWRSAVSRAYYAAFHVAGQVLAGAGLVVPDGHQAHAYLWLRLSNSGQTDVCEAGRLLNVLRGPRNRADYNLRLPFSEEDAFTQVQEAVAIIRTLEDLTSSVEVLGQVAQAIREYERDVLREVTYRTP